VAHNNDSKKLTIVLGDEMRSKYLIITILTIVITGCSESDRYPNAQACGNGEYMMERGEGFSTEKWNGWCDAYGVSR
jgi:hypothetical protein